ncbi:MULTISPECIES: metal-dependent hydrolase [Bacillus]|uniref:metal-dependent hydrolase n=1 Tax=Bacillus TaxID=1386 RepID=UPI0004D68429|nr:MULTISPECIES: metal-dependent hydrolase [Bacillus]MBW4850477.1 metal-dependent hydrolase [Bacillaceae bacterium]MBY0189998.1 metal-dependent hydrolase [Bacillus aerophilus]AYJ91312.1 metal-dependent hydrolase [Bacillus safensis]KEP30242.1 membrane protein [Bacillus safensis]KMK71710.1 membrane protein [Bacillus safensis]
MDTGTHVVMGISLGGLALLDPAVSADPHMAHAVMIATIAGSQAPDIDTVLKLKNNAVYIRNHRGFTHSIPAVLFWSLLIPAVIFPFVPGANLLHLWLWTLLAVVLHVFVDIFNAYGTQAIRPFSKKWVALGIINTFDPFIFFTHLVAIVVWAIGGHPGYTFITLYAVIFCYYIVRVIMQLQIKRQLRARFDEIEEIIISPTMKFRQWRIAVKCKSSFHVGRSMNGEVVILDTFNRVPVPDTEIMKIAKQDENISAFLSFSPVYRWEVDKYKDHYEVRFIDLRYRSKGHYPFVAICHIDMDHQIKNSYTGWIFSEEKLQKKLRLGSV